MYAFKGYYYLCLISPEGTINRCFCKEKCECASRAAILYLKQTVLILICEVLAGLKHNLLFGYTQSVQVSLPSCRCSTNDTWVRFEMIVSPASPTRATGVRKGLRTLGEHGSGTEQDSPGPGWQRCIWILLD